jgi:hypothetical protein
MAMLQAFESIYLHISFSLSISSSPYLDTSGIDKYMGGRKSLVTVNQSIA